MRPFLLFLIGGIILLNILMMSLFPAEMATLPDGFSTPIIAFEFVQTPEEVRDLFGSNNKQRSEWITAMRQGHLADSFYLIFYSTFLGILGWIAAKRSGRTYLYAIIPLAILAAASDAAENLQLVALSYLLDQGDMLTEIRLLFVFTWLKWGSLALGLAALSGYLIRQHLWGKVYTVLSILTLILGVLAFVERSFITSIFTLAIAVLFLNLFLIVFIKKDTFSLSAKA